MLGRHVLTQACASSLSLVPQVSLAPCFPSPCSPTPGPQVYVGNDDDPSCTANPKASRLSTTMQAGVTYYIVLDGYSGAWLDSQGLFTLTVAPSVATA